MALPTSAESAGAFRLVSAAEDPEQAYIRRCCAELALICDQLPIPPTGSLALHPRTLTAKQLEQIHSYTDPARAGCELARLTTGLPDEMLALIAGDQITHDAILGCPVPEQARPILRAIDETNEAAFHMFVDTPPGPIEDAASADYEFAAALGWLLRGRSSRIRARELTPNVGSQFETLRSDGIVDRSYRVYRASHVALYSSFRAASTLDLCTHKRMSRSTATT